MKYRILLIILCLNFTPNIISQEYYKTNSDASCIKIYKDHKFSSNDFNQITDLECIPYTHEVHQEESVLKQKIFGTTIVVIYEAYEKYGKIKVFNQDVNQDEEWWISLEYLTKLSNSETQKYMMLKSKNPKPLYDIDNLSNFTKHYISLRWSAIIIGFIILILVLGLKIKQSKSNLNMY